MKATGLLEDGSISYYRVCQNWFSSSFYFSFKLSIKYKEKEKEGEVIWFWHGDCFCMQSKLFTAARLNWRQLLKLYCSCPSVTVPPRRDYVLTGLPAAALLSYKKLIKLLFTFSAWFHTSISPRYFSGRVERFSLKENPKTSYTVRKNCRQLFISSSIFMRIEVKSQIWKNQLIWF